MSIGVAASDMRTALGGTAKAGIVRSSGTIGCYLVLAFFTFVLTLQGTIAPFLKADLGLSYRMVGLHASAIAIGAILVGLAGTGWSEGMAGAACSSWASSDAWPGRCSLPRHPSPPSASPVAP